MFRAGLLLIIRRHYSVYTAIGTRHAFMLAASKHKRMTHDTAHKILKTTLASENYYYYYYYYYYHHHHHHHSPVCKVLQLCI
jgi:hypothetical protein